jgi:hypothetical protein
MIPKSLPMLAFALGLAACAAPPPPSDPRLIITPAASSLSFSPPSVNSGPDGRLRVNVNVVNPHGADFPLRIQTDWLDETGRPISTLQSRPVFRSLARQTVTTIDADAPNPRARDFRMTFDIGN